MERIQDIRNLENQIISDVQDYIDNMDVYNDSFVIIDGKESNILLSSLVVDGEIDIDAINDLASKYFFVR